LRKNAAHRHGWQLRMESQLLDQKFDAQPGTHFFVERMFKRTGYALRFSCEAACDASVDTFRAGGQHPMRCIRCASIFNNIIRNGKALLARGLSGKNMFSMFAADLIAQHGALDLRLFRHINDQYAIGFGGQAVFDQQRNDPEKIRGGGGLHLAARFLLNQRMQQRVKPGFFLHVSKNFSRSRRRFSVPSGQSSAAKVAGDGLERRGAGFYHLAGDNIGINNVNPELREGVGDRTFTAADPAC
jgi:hypothetical protein